MPANLTPQYREAEAKYRAAVTTEEKLAALDEMMAVIPKHKGTEKMRADIKRRIAKLKQRDKSSGSAKRGLEVHIDKEGAGQVAIAGPPNSGKSLIVGRLTAAEPEVADYPFTTRRPMPGMMEYQDILIQLVDMPPIAAEATDGWVLALARSADVVAVVIDLAEGAMVDDIEMIRAELERSKVLLVSPGEEMPSSLPVGTVVRRAIIVGNKVDLPGAADNLEILKELYDIDLPIVPVSAKTGEGLEQLKSRLFSLLDIVRVYTKIPGKQADLNTPFVFQRGSTVADLAAAVHKDVAHRLRFARAWGKNKPDGAMMGRDQELEDKDIVELHA